VDLLPLAVADLAGQPLRRAPRDLLVPRFPRLEHPKFHPHLCRRDLLCSLVSGGLLLGLPLAPLPERLLVSYRQATAKRHAAMQQLKQLWQPARQKKVRQLSNTMRTSVARNPKRRMERSMNLMHLVSFLTAEPLSPIGIVLRLLMTAMGFLMCATKKCSKSRIILRSIGMVMLVNCFLSIWIIMEITEMMALVVSIGQTGRRLSRILSSF